MAVGDKTDSPATSMEPDQSLPTERSEEVDEFGLPHRPISRLKKETTENSDDEDTFHDAKDSNTSTGTSKRIKSTENGNVVSKELGSAHTLQAVTGPSNTQSEVTHNVTTEKEGDTSVSLDQDTTQHESKPSSSSSETKVSDSEDKPELSRATSVKSTKSNQRDSASFPAIKRVRKKSEPPHVAEHSHQQLTAQKQDSDEDEEEVEWQAMQAIDEFDVYDDDGRLVARGTKEVDEEDDNPYSRMGGAGRGYTRVLLDEDARSATSLDDDTDYLFKKPQQSGEKIDEEDIVEDDQRDVLGQLQATKELLTEGQRIAYVGVVRLTVFKMLRALDTLERTKSTKKEFLRALENMEMWGQQMMVRLYKHMEISVAEQLMIEQLAEHGLEPADLAPPLMINAKVKNPMAENGIASPNPDDTSRRSSLSEGSGPTDASLKEVKNNEEVPEVHGVEEMPTTAQINLDIRWTVLCDLFLVLISDSIYDARSRRLLERVGTVMNINWTQICRFEKRVIDQLEMDEAAKENWDESEHMEDRRKRGLKKKYMYMGLATVGGGLVIGLSAGLLAPMIGAGLAAGFTTIGVSGTATFLGGVGGAALITSAATAAGGTIAIRASNRRTGHVKTFEYRPLHNNKRLNLILTVSGWMTGKVDDVRLPFSTVDPIMGDVYSLLWEPEMLRSMGDTISILATEALTSTVQQVLGSTILVALMASLQLPVVLTKLSYLIDNPWAVSLDRANAAGLILADSLMARHLGQRPVTLVGFSLGARLVFSCLKELANRGGYGIVQNVYLFGSPVVAKKEEYLRARSVIAGRFVNGYATNDWILGYLFRATSGGIGRVAGLAAIENVPGLENLDVTDLVNGHMAYRAAMPKLLMRLSWEVESDEFTEIEDPDPENHAQRQRELIAEIDEARRKAEEKPQKRRFGIFRRGKLAEKREWEKYSNDPKKSPEVNIHSPDSFEQNAVFFDVDAIRKELLSEQIEVRELDSTQPPMQFTTIKDGQKQTEYLRLPAGMKPEEVAKMKLPPRPEEIDDDHLSPPMRNGIQRTVSSPITPQVPKRTHSPKKHEDYEFEMPKELVSTLPPLRLTPQVSHPSLSPNLSARSSNGSERPDYKKRDTEPIAVPTVSTSPPTGHTPATGATTTALAGLALGSPLAGFASPELDMDHNAWADDGDGEIKMTFE